MKAHVYKRGSQWLVDAPNIPIPVQVFEWAHAMDLANEYARMAQFSAKYAGQGPSWRELTTLPWEKAGLEMRASGNA